MKRAAKPPVVHASLLEYLQAGFITWVRSIFGIQTSHSTKIAELEAQLAQGASFNDNFNRPDSVLLGNGWQQGGAGQQLGIIDYAAGVNPTGIAAGRRYAYRPTPMPTDNHSAIGVVNPDGVAVSAMTSLFIRANADLTKFVYANVYGKSIYLGWGTRAGNVWTYHDWRSTTSRGVGESDTVELKADGSVYSIIVNNTPVLTYDDTAGEYPIGNDWRTVGFAIETRVTVIIPTFSWGLASFTARTAMASVAGIQESADAAAAAAAALAGTVSDVADTVNELVGERDAEAAAGKLIFVNFSKYNVNDIPTEFNYSNPGFLYVNGNKHFAPAYSGADVGWAWLKEDLTNDDMQGTVVIGQNGTLDAGLGIVLRTNATRTSGMVAILYYDHIEYWRFTATAGTNVSTWTQVSTNVDTTLTGGDTVTFRVVNETYYTLKNNQPLSSFTNVTPGTPPKGVAYRRVGMYVKQTAGLFTIPPHRPSSFSASDYATPTYKGTGFRLFRSSTGTVSAPSGTLAVPAGTYDTAGIVAGYCEIANLGFGQMRIKKEGWWVFTMRHNVTAAMGTGIFAPALFRVKSGGGWSLVEQGEDNTGSNVYSVQTTFQLYCFVDDIVTSGYYLSTGKSINGNAAGTAMMFSGQLSS